MLSGKVFKFFIVKMKDVLKIGLSQLVSFSWRSLAYGKNTRKMSVGLHLYTFKWVTELNLLVLASSQIIPE